MKTIAFYAFKGGTGRTLSLLCAARHLARANRRVVVLDLDLGAPGIWPLVSDAEPPEGFVELAADWLAGDARPVREYLHEVRLVLKRVLHSKAFTRIAVARGIQPLSPETAETTSIEAAYTYLDLLFEERIWTGKNSLSRNWILRRLEDANSVIFPRDILCLLQQAALEEERRLRDRNRTAQDAVLSRESLQRALIPTSKQRVDAVREEYPELAALLASLSGLNANGKLQELSSYIERVPGHLGENVIVALRRAGVLGIDGDEYRVPALYHYGLNMIRPGPT